MKDEEKKQADLMIKYLSDKMAMLFRENAALYSAAIQAQTRLNQEEGSNGQGDRDQNVDISDRTN